MTNWTHTAELQAAAARLPSDEGAHAMALFRGGDWRAAVAYAQERLAYHHRSAAPLAADRIIEHQRWKAHTFDQMRDALGQIAAARTLEEAHDLARKALNE
jgi:hypothetical protein